MTQEAIDKLKENNDPIVQELLTEYLEYTTDPRKKFALECSLMMNVISGDFKVIREVNKDDEQACKEAAGSLKLLGSNKDDKLFERIMAVLTNAAKIADNIGMLQNDKPEEKKGRRGKKDEDKNIPSTFS